MANFDDIKLFGNKSLSDIFKQIHKNQKDTDDQANELVEMLKPLVTNPGSAVMLMPTVKDLIDVKVKNNEQLIKMAAIAQRAANTGKNDESTDLFDMSEVQGLIEEHNKAAEKGNKLIEGANKLAMEELPEAIKVEK